MELGSQKYPKLEGIKIFVCSFTSFAFREVKEVFDLLCIQVEYISENTLYEALFESHPSLLLIDISEELSGGFDLIKDLKSHYIYENIPIVPIIREECFNERVYRRYGVYAFIIKPYISRQVSFAIKTTLLKYKEESLEISITEGYKALNSKNYKKAFEIFNQLRKKKISIRIEIGLFQSLLSLGEKDKLDTSLNEIRNIDKNLFLLKLLELNKAVKTHAREQILQACLRDVVPLEKVYNRVAMILQHFFYEDFLDLGIAFCQKNLRKLSYEKQFFLWFAKLYYKNKQYELAEEVLLKGQQEDSETSDSINLLGVIYTALKQYPKAILSYKRAMQLNPLDYKIPYNIALCYLKIESYENAFEMLDESLSLNPKDEKFIENINNLKKKYSTSN